GGLDPVGVACALGAALCWALYIVFGQRVGHLHGGRAVAIGMSVAALVVLPFGIATAGTLLLQPAMLGFGLAVAALSSALP
ncbi:EamA family transporter, partial [Escherichia coli]|uniref:EamA family transporter n=1 Tax=Escherichia coli TaxID=562 RepID=UPI0034D76B22